MTAIIRKRGIVWSHPRKAELMEEVCRVWTIAREHFPEFTLAVIDVAVVLTNSGRAAGCMKRLGDVYNLEFNTKVMDMDWGEIIDAIPHEIAHLVDRFIHECSSHHGPRWKQIVRRLGGTGKRTHSVNVAPSRKQRRFTYVATCGTEVEVSTKLHNMFQCGATRRVRRTKGIVNNNCFIGEVGKANAYVNIG
jgi:predicted SprT family Zn-dependent metalloprotease